jgi:parallel beta-helix repeat protein
VPTDFPTIQDAINNAADGDTIYVHNGTYLENVIVNKPVSLVGENETLTFVDGHGVGPAIEVTAENVSISGFTFGNGTYGDGGTAVLLYKVRYVNLTFNVAVSSYAGVSLVNSSMNSVQGTSVSACNVSLCLNFSDSNILFKNTLMSSALAGIYLWSSSNNTVEENGVTDGGAYGIYLNRSHHNKLLANMVKGCSNGVLLDYSDDNTLAGNNMTSNQYNFGVLGASLSDFIQDINTSNKVDGKSVYYLVNKNDVFLNTPLSQDIGYLAVINSSNIRAKGLGLSSNGEGFLFAYSTNCLIQESNIASNKRGAFTYNSPDCRVVDCSFVANLNGVSFSSSANSSVVNSFILDGGGHALRIESSGNSVVEGNTIKRNSGGGVSLDSSPNCNISRNVVMTNGFGILAQVSIDARVTDNLVTNNSGDGVYFSYCDLCLAQGNNVTGNGGYGLGFLNCKQSVAADNYVSNNTLSGIFFYACELIRAGSNIVKFNVAGINLQSCTKSTVYGNEVAGNKREGIVLLDSPNANVSSNMVFDDGEKGLAFQNSGNSTTSGNVAYGNGQSGIWLQDSPYVDVLGSNLSSNALDGVYVRGSNGSRVVNSIMSSNGNAGCRIYGSSLITFVQNNVTENQDGLLVFVADGNTISSNRIMQNHEYGISVLNSTGNKLYHNSLVNNSQNVKALFAPGNVWDDGYPDGGNFWSDYAGTDVHSGPGQDQPGSDGIGDTPYTIDSENKDRYPLMNMLRFHDLTLERGVLPSIEVYPGWVLGVNVTVRNSGGYIESFNVTLTYNSTLIETRLVNKLQVGGNLFVRFTWNTSGLPPCQNCHVQAAVSAVPGETHVEDNVYDFGFVKVKMIGDVNGDMKVNILDIAAIATAFQSGIGEPRYRLNYDINLDFVINILDISMAAINFGKSCR